MENAKPHELKRVGGSLYIKLLPPFVRANNLKPGDFVIVDLTKIKVLHAEEFALLGKELEPEPEEAA